MTAEKEWPFRVIEEMTSAEFRDMESTRKAEALMLMSPQQLIAFWEQFESPYIDGLTRAWRAERTIGVQLSFRLKMALEREEAREREDQIACERLNAATVAKYVNGLADRLEADAAHSQAVQDSTL